MYIGSDAAQSGQINVYQQQAEKLARARQEKEGATQNATASQGDSVKVSSEARLMAEASRTARETPDVRQEKVAMLKEQVENGTYEVDNRRIAQGLLRDDMDLFV